MSEALIVEMRKESARLKNLAAQLDTFIEQYISAAAPPKTTILSAPPRPTTPRMVFHGGGEPVPMIKPDYSQMSQADVVYDVLSRSPNQELERHEIYNLAVAGGASIKSADHLSPIMSRDGRFKPTARGFWMIVPKKEG